MAIGIASDTRDAADVLSLILDTRSGLDKTQDKDVVRETIRSAIIRAIKEAGLSLGDLAELKVQIRQWKYDNSITVSTRIRSNKRSRGIYGRTIFPYAKLEIAKSREDKKLDEMKTYFYRSSDIGPIEKHYLVLAMTLLEIYGFTKEEAFDRCKKEGVIKQI